MSSLTLSLAQMDIHLGEPRLNLQRLRTMLAEASQRRSQILILPELWSTGYVLGKADILAETLPDGSLPHTLSMWAQEFGLWIIGSLLIRTPAGIINGAPWFGPQGEISEPYAKIHRFGLMDEDRWLVPGCRPGLFDLPWGRVGMGICYDLRFPELFRAYAVKGTKLMVLPSEWPHPRLEHWRILLRARAIENQCFFVGVNRVGCDDANTFCGHSAVIDPWGETICEGEEEEVLLTATIELDEVDAARQHIPVLRDRRPECYESMA